MRYSVSLGSFGNLTSWVGSHAATMPGLILLRALPAAVYLLVARNTSLVGKTVSAIGLIALLVVAKLVDPLWRDLAIYGPLLVLYFLIATAVSIGACRQGLGRFSAFILFVAVFVILPALFPFGSLRSFGVVVGWEFLLASYSIRVDGYVGRRRPRVSEHLFFVLVNPCIVYLERGQQSGRVGPRGLGRCLLGALVILCGRLAQATVDRHRLADLSSASYVVGLVLLSGTYMQHSGLASVQIGLMRSIGWDIPERYRYPLFASSPAEFWARWNTYVGSWVRRYVFTPTARLFLRSSGMHRQGGRFAAVLAAFVTIGALHELPTLAQTWSVSWIWLTFFVTQALWLIAWELGMGSSGRTLGPAELGHWHAFMSRSCRTAATISGVVLSVMLMGRVVG